MPFATDYIDVAARIVEFRAKHAEGTLQAEVIRWPEDGFPFIAVEARAYRTPDDPRPGVGLAYEPFPGKTNFTRDSELQNAETSAWGRALVAVGAADTRKGIASADEVRNRSASSTPEGDADRKAANAGGDELAPSTSRSAGEAPSGAGDTSAADVASVAEGEQGRPREVAGPAPSGPEHMKPEPHAPDMHAVKAGSSLTRCAFAGCPVAGKVAA